MQHRYFNQNCDRFLNQAQFFQCLNLTTHNHVMTKLQWNAGLIVIKVINLHHFGDTALLFKPKSRSLPKPNQELFLPKPNHTPC